MSIRAGIFAFFLAAFNNVFADVIPADSCSEADVQTALDASVSGDVVTIPAGNCVWGSGKTIPAGVRVEGAGRDNTLIDSSSFITIYLSDNSYIKDIQMENGVARGNSGNQNWVVEDCAFATKSTSRENITLSALDKAAHQTGVFHGSSFHGIRFVMQGVGLGEEEWAKPDDFGGINEVVYVEGCSFTYVGGNGAVGDGNLGGKAVWRFNDFGVHHVQTHGSRGPNSRGQRKSEWYRNIFHREPSDASPYALWDRGGGAIMFDNNCTGESDRCEYHLDTERVYESWGEICSGTSPWETNPHPATGTDFMCRDATGAGQDLNPPSPDLPSFQNDQEYSPGYFWNNLYEGSIGEFRPVNGAPSVIIEDRDYFLDDSSEPGYGNGGVSSGLYVNRPVCDAAKDRHGYWATDMGGDWNSTDEWNGDDGALYVCDGAGTWNLYYTPAPYPHPLVMDGSLPPTTGLLAPTRVQVRM